MFGSDVIDVGIGVVLIFLFTSLIATALREGLETFLQMRARDLELGLRELLDDPTGRTITKDLYDHPMIYALFLGDYDPTGLKDGRVMSMRQGRHLPAYIPSAQFAEALLDRVAKGAVAAQPDVNAVWSQMSIESLRASIGLLPSARLQRAIGSALDQAQGDILKAKGNLETWFNSAMDRVSGRYKKRSQIVLFVIGLLAAAALNVDALEVVQRLVHDKDLRAAAVGYAEKIVPEKTDGPASAPTLPADLQNTTFEKLKSQIEEIGYPIGWSPQIPQWQDRKCTTPSGSEPEACSPPGWWIRIKMVLGWFITALAVMLGAPFWFDVLNKFMIVRSTVKPREKSRDEASKDARSGGSSDDGGDEGDGGGSDGPPPPRNPVPPPAAGAAPALVAAFVPHEWANAADKQEGRI